MRKLFKLATWTFAALLVATTAMAAGTETSWSLSMQFKLDGVDDVKPVVIGTGTSASSLLRPPSLPDKTVTGDSKDVWVRASVPDPTSRVAAFMALAATNQKVWTLSIDPIEAGHTVSATFDTSNFFSGYSPITVVIPDSNAPVIEVRTTSTVDLFTTDGTAKTLYVVATGASKAFAASSAGKVIGMVNVPGATAKPANADVTLYDAGCAAAKTTTTDANGLFTLSGVADGTYTVHINMPNYLGGECTITADALNAGETSCAPLYAGDVNNDGRIDVKDLMVIKPYYNKSKTQLGGDDPSGDWVAKKLDVLDSSGDSKIDIKDLMIIKNAYNTKETFKCGS